MHKSPTDEEPARADTPWAGLTLVADGDEVVIGEVRSGIFVAVPAVGAAIVRALQCGHSMHEVAAFAERAAGGPVDILAFLAELRSAGLLGDESASPLRTAPIQQRNWLRDTHRSTIRWLFGPAAWCAYGTALLLSLAMLAARPEQWHGPNSVFVLDDVGLSAWLLVVLNLTGTATHEGWHWLAARSAGVQARFGLDRRWYFLVAETDLSQIWALPRRRRYGPLMAGVAIDSILLATLLTVELGMELELFTMPTIVGRLVAAQIFLITAGMLFQCLIFFRTDLYGVLVVATGCRNLWRTKTLLLRNAFGRLTVEESEELRAAHPRDLEVGAWFRWIWLAGAVPAVAWFVWFSLPILLTMLSWLANGLAAGPGDRSFWWAIACMPLFLASRTLVVGLLLRDIGRRTRGRSRHTAPRR